MLVYYVQKFNSLSPSPVTKILRKQKCVFLYNSSKIAISRKRKYFQVCKHVKMLRVLRSDRSSMSLFLGQLGEEMESLWGQKCPT